jgi:hypothetical protein
MSTSNIYFHLACDHIYIYIYIYLYCAYKDERVGSADLGFERRYASREEGTFGEAKNAHNGHFENASKSSTDDDDIGDGAYIYIYMNPPSNTQDTQ